MNRTQNPAKAYKPGLRAAHHLYGIASIIGLAFLLITVAFLQYRWNFQIRRSTEIRLGTDLESMAIKWHVNLYREFSTVCIALQVGPDSGAHNQWNDYLRRYVDWRNSARNSAVTENIYSNPDIVRDVYVYESSAKPLPKLFRFDPDSIRVEPAANPANLKRLLNYLQQRSANLRIALRAWEFSDPLETDQLQAEMHEFRAGPITGWQFDEEIPAIVHPIVHHNAIPRNRENAVDWIVIVLSGDTIQHTIFPKLAQLYFSGPRGLEFKVAVKTEGDQSRVLFSSDQGFGTSDLNRSDLVMNIFGPPPESTEGSFWEVERDRDSLRGTEWHNFSAPVWFPVIRRASASGPWTLLLQHRDAPLEASIARAWRGNLLVASIVLLLLAASMSLVILASRRVESLAKLQLDFVSSVSHELRTPLAAILSAGQNINDGFARDLPHYGSIITTQAHRLIDMVDQILLLTSMRAGKKQYQLGPVDVASVIESLQKSVKPILEEAGFLLECQVQEHLPAVFADQEALVRCLQNLIENAVKYSGGNRWIGVFVQLDESTPHRQELKFSVADRGIGIAQSELAHIFQPFYRGKHAIVAQIPGTGLGLSVVKQVVTAIRGRLSVTSELGVGSIFTLHVGIADDPVQKIELEEALSSQ